MIIKNNDLKIYPENINSSQYELINQTELISFTANPLIIEKKKVFLTKSGIVLSGFKIIKETIPRYKGKFKHFLKYVYFQLLFKKKRFRSGHYIIIHNHWCPGYYHWFTEALPRLINIERLTDMRTILMPSHFPNYCHESILKLGDFQIEFYKENLFVSHITIPENTRYTGYYDIANLRIIRDRLLIATRKSQSLKRVYISRVNAARRKVKNEAQLYPILQKYQIEIIETEKLSLEEQIQLFSKTELLISIHGAGLTNMIYLPSNASVLELQMHPQKNQINILYLKLANIFSLKYYILLSDIVGPNQSLYESDLEVNLEEFDQLIQQVLN